MGGNGGMKDWKERGRVKGASGGERSAHSRSPSFWRVKTSINWVCGRVSVRSAIQASASPGCSEIWSISLRRQIRWEKISLLLSSKKQKKNLRQRRLYKKIKSCDSTAAINATAEIVIVSKQVSKMLPRLPLLCYFLNTWFIVSLTSALKKLQGFNTGPDLKVFLIKQYQLR